MAAVDYTRYWEDRARRFAATRAGLAAVCSYGMPEFYNRAIDACQRLALRPWLRVPPGTTVLDAGCGIGRWSRRLARSGAKVTGVDLSSNMLAEAARRTAAEGLEVRYVLGSLVDFSAGPHSLILGVTVLQHILDADAFEAAVRNLARHLAPGGRMVLLEAAPARRNDRCDSVIFTARDIDTYLRAFRAAGLRVEAITGVDPAPFKTWLLPHYRRLPRPLANAALAIATLISFPIDAVLGRVLARVSWHKVFVLSHDVSATA